MMVNDNGEESSDTGSNPNGIGIENANSSLYMHPSDNPGAALVPIPFDGTGFRSWKRGVYRALSVKNKLGFVNGECKRPDLETPQYRQWESCGAKESVFRAEQERRLIQFLMGLNETYTAVRGNILMMNPLPLLAQTFSLLVQDEKQREIKPNTQLFMESTSLNVGNSGKMIMESGSFNASSSGGASTSRQPR
ncbi:hypothetical protein KY289_038006 [Solanum tuberosum]|nr:hypothetical protein KY289_038006 [Solanum tuberosum]